MKTKAIVNVASDEALALLEQNFPSEQGFTRTFLPRLGLVTQDKFEGKGKAAHVVAEAGTFFTEVQTEEEDENGKKIWDKKEIGTEIEGIIVYKRQQLRYYDESTEQYTSSPVFDTNEDIIPLFSNKQEVARGTATELKARPEYQYEKDGKVKSKLEDNRILYVLYEGELYQLNLRGSSMYSYMSFAKTTKPSTCLTKFSSTAESKGTIEWNKMSFTKVRDLTQEEAEEVIAKQREIIAGIAEEKKYFATQAGSVATADDELKKF